MTVARCVLNCFDKRLNGFKNSPVFIGRQVALDIAEKIGKTGLHFPMLFPPLSGQGKSHNPGIRGGWFFGQESFVDQGIDQAGGCAFFHAQEPVQIGNPEIFILNGRIEDDILMKRNAAAEGRILPQASCCPGQADENTHPMRIVDFVLFHNGCNIQLSGELSRVNRE